MQQCWVLDPEERPTFASLKSSLIYTLESLANYLTLSQEDLEVTQTTSEANERVSPRYVQDPTSSQRFTAEGGHTDLNREQIIQSRSSILSNTSKGSSYHERSYVNSDDMINQHSVSQYEEQEYTSPTEVTD